MPQPAHEESPSDANLTRVSALIASVTREPSDPHEVASAMALRLADPDESFDDALASLRRETGANEARALAAMLRAMAFFNAAAAELRATGRPAPDSPAPVLARVAERVSATTVVCRAWGDEIVVSLDDATYLDVRQILGLVSH